MSDNNNKNFVNFHVLISHSPSNLNRDDMGMQKTATFGGVKRTRISSQSLKRAIRKSEYYCQHLGQPSIRTKELAQFIEKMKESLKERYSNEVIELAIYCLCSKDKKDKDGKEQKKNITSKEKDDSEKSESTIAWVKSEVEFICEQIRNTEVNSEEISKEKKKKGNNKKSDEALKVLVYQSKLKNKLKDDKEQLKQNISNAKDIALSGRMTTSGIMMSVDGALAVAHAITTHGMDSEIDWFTAVDDLKQEEGSEDKGSAHLDTTEFSSGVFYRYASLDLRQLQKNLGDESNRSRALEVASHVLHLLATVTPSAKQNAFAAHNLADFALVSFSHQPLSFANAFEVPVKPIKSKFGLFKPSVEALLEYQKKVADTYSLTDDPKAFYSVQPVIEERNDNELKDFIQDLTDHKNLEKLKEWILNDTEEDQK